jgi:hypothetical protein
LWEISVDGEIKGVPLMGYRYIDRGIDRCIEEYVLVGSHDGHLYQINALTGKIYLSI